MNTENEEKIVAGTWRGAFTPPASIPERADIVVIGGGIVGVSTAWFLARQGIDVVLCEKGHIAGEQSGRNWGWVRQQGRDTRELPMMIESMRIFRGLEDEIGESVGFSQGGCLFTANNERQLQDYHEWLNTAKEFELDTRIIDADELGKLAEGASPKWHGAMYTPSDGSRRRSPRNPNSSAPRSGPDRARDADR